MTVGVYPGSFDPFTVGHLDVLTNAAGLFDLVYVAVLYNVDKRPVFTVDERMDMIRNVIAAEKLDSHRTLLVSDRTQLRGLAVAVADALCGDHFADNISRTVLLTHEPVRSVRNSCHGSKRSCSRHSHASYFNCISHCAAPQYRFPYS